jgi:hypothetical protein
MQLNSRRNYKSVGQAADSLAYLLEALPAVTTRKGFRPFEAASARMYFQALSYLLPEAFNFKGRSADLAGDRIRYKIKDIATYEQMAEICGRSISTVKGWFKTGRHYRRPTPADLRNLALMDFLLEHFEEIGDRLCNLLCGAQQ